MPKRYGRRTGRTPMRKRFPTKRRRSRMSRAGSRGMRQEISAIGTPGLARMSPSMLRSNSYYTPPAGRLMARGAYASMKWKCTFDTSLQYSVANGFEHLLRFSDFYKITPSPDPGPYTVLKCPDFYRCIYGWNSFNVFGMKIQVRVQPRWVPGTAGETTSYIPGYCSWSIIEPQPAATPQLGPPGSVPTLITIRPESLQAMYESYRVEKFDLGHSLTHLGQPRQFISRYTKLPRLLTKNVGVNSVTWSANSNGSYVNNPVLNVVQNDHVIHLGIPLSGVPDEAATALYYRVKGTLYGRSYNRVRTPISQFWQYELPGAAIGAAAEASGTLDPIPGLDPAIGECGP